MEALVELNFEGKPIIYAHHITVPIRPLVPDRSKSLNPTDDDNLIIHGDSLHALKALLPRYAGRVRCIYIDPPYNIGKKKWIYNDNVNSPLMQRWLKEAKEVDGEDLERHEKWLCMMWPRLQLLKSLLADEGLIFISINDAEQAPLKLMCEEIFGKNNFVAVLTIVSNFSGRSDKQYFATAHEYMIVFRQTKNAETYGLDLTAKQLKEYKYEGEFGRYSLGGFRKRGSGSERKDRPNLYYPIFVNPNDKTISLKYSKEYSVKVWPKLSSGKDGRWRWGKDRVNQYLDELTAEVVSGRNEWDIKIKEYLTKNGETKTRKLKTFLHDSAYSSDSATSTLREIFDGQKVFDTPKPHVLIKDIIEYVTTGGDVILDSFAGSGTTAHAALELNKEDGGNRKFILVECEDYADTLTAERVRRVINGIPSSKKYREPLDGSFTYCTLGKPLDIGGILTGKDLPDYSTLASHLLYTATGMSINKKLKRKNKDGLFHSTGDTDYYLLYEPNLRYLRSDEAVLDDKRARRIRKAGKRAVVFGSGKHMGQRDLTHMKIEFCTVPDGIRQV